MHPWTADQLGAFLSWSRGASGLHAVWWLLACTGMRRVSCWRCAGATLT
jgi:hypothetical protein